jgi:hypothetical protein
MAEFEGWTPDGNFGDDQKQPSRAYRNHNPGNLRSSIFQAGLRDSFAYFISDGVGMFAMQYDIMQKCRGKTVTTLTGDSILAELIAVYSASEGEELANYVKHVTSRTGLEPHTKLSDIIK